MRLKLCLLLVFIITFSWAQTTKTFTTNGAFPVPAGVTSITVQAWGGGGSGGGASGAPLLLGRGAAGGGGGAYASAPLSVTGGTTLNVVVAGQTAGNSANGTAGGNSTITGFESTILAAGGSGGAANSAGGTPTGGVGGTIAASAGTTRLAGANGGNGNSWNLLGLLLSSGAGGNGGGSGGAGGTAVSGLLLSNGPGNAGSPPGGAGSGAINSALGAAQIGGAGAAGRVIISYTCATFSLTSTAAANVCAATGSTSAVTLTGSAASLPVGNYVVTYNRSNPSATALTANLTVTTTGTGTFTAVGLTAAGSSTITITNLTSETCSSNITTNNTATVIVSPASVGGSVTGGTTINAGSTSGLLTLSGHTGSVIKWQSSVSPFTTWTDIANTTTTYTSGVLNETTQFRAVVQSGSCAVANSAATTVTVNPRPTITLESSALSRCATTDGGSSVITLEYTATTENPTTYSIVWNSSPANSLVNVTDSALLTNLILIDIPAGTVPGTYTGTLTVKNANGAVSSPGTVFTVTFNEIPIVTTTGAISSVCSSTSSQNATLAYSGVTGNPTSYFINWNSAANTASLADQGPTSLALAPGSGTINSIVVSANASPGTYNGLMYISNGSCLQIKNVSITIVPETVGGTVTGGTTIISGNTSGLLTLSGHTGSVIKWQSAVSPFTTWTDIANTTTTYTSGVLTETTQFRAVVQSGSCSVVNSAATTVTVNPRPTIALDSSASSICTLNIPTTPLLAVLRYGGTTGSPTTYSIVWNSSPPNNFSLITDAPLPASPITLFFPGSTPAGTYTGTLTVKNANGAVSSPGSVFTVTVNDVPTITTTGTVTAVTTSSSAQTASLPYSASTLNPVRYNIDWNSAANTAGLADQPITLFAFASGGGVINTINVPANVPAGTYSGTLFISNNTCNNSYQISLTINARPTITLAASAQDVCTDGSATTTTLSYSATTGAPTTYSIVWNSSPTNSFAAVTDAALPASPITIAVPAGTADGTYTGTLTVKNAGGSSLGSNFSVTIQETPTITIYKPIDPVCESTSLQYARLEYAFSTGDPTSYSIDWDATANAASLADQPNTAYSFLPIGGGLLTVEVSANAQPGTYSGTMYIYSGNCIGSHSVSITISPETVGGTVIGGSTIISGNTSGLLELSGNTGSIIKWQSAVSPFTTWTDIPATADAIAYQSGELTETTQFRAVVQSGVCSVVNSEPTTVTVGEQPTITVSTQQNNFCVVGSNNVPASFFPLFYTATTGSPVTYSIVWDSSPANSLAPVTDAALSNSPIFVAIAAGTNFGIYTGTITVKNAAGITSVGSTFILNLERDARITTAGTITPVTISTSAQTTTLPYSAFEGNPVSYSIDWNGTANASSLADQPSTSFTATTGGGVINTIAISANAQAGSYNGTLTLVGAGGCSKTYEVNIVINPVAPPTITLASNTISICGSSSYSGELPYTGTTGNPVTYSLVWSSSPSNSIPSVIDAVLPSSPIDISVSVGTVDGTYQATLTVKDANGNVSNPIVITANVETTPNFQTEGDITSVATSTSAQTTTLDYDSVFANPLGYSIDWNAAANAALLQDQPYTAFDFSPGSGFINNIVVSANVPSGTYSGTLTVQGAFCGLNTKSVTITVNPVVPPTITLLNSIEEVCLSGSPNPFVRIPYSATTGNPITYSVVWSSTPTNNFVPVTDAVLGEDVIDVPIPSNTTSGTYEGTLTVKNANGLTSDPIVFVLKVGRLPDIITNGIITTVDTSASAQTTTLEYSDLSGPPLSYSINWNSTANTALLQDQPNTPFTDTSGDGVISTIAVSANAQAGTYTGTMILEGVASCSTFKTVTLTINPVEPPSITLPASTVEICLTGLNFKRYVELPYSETTGNPITYSIAWNSSPANSFVAVTDAVLNSDVIDVEVPYNAASGTYEGTLTVKNASGLVSSPVTFYVKVGQVVSMTITGITPVFASTSAQTTTLTYSAYGGDPVSYSIDWNSTANAALLADQPSTPFTPVSGGGTIDTIQIAANVPPGTYSGTLTIRGVGGCSTTRAVSVTINPVEPPSITLPASTINICTDNRSQPPGILPYSGTTGNPTTYSLVWDSSPANNLTSITDEPLEASRIVIRNTATTADGTYTGTLTVKNANGDVSDPIVITANIGRLPFVASSNTLASVSASNSSQITTLSYSNVFYGNPVEYRIDWDADANNALLQDQPSTPYTFFTNGGTINNIQVSANVPAGTYHGELILKGSAVCEFSINITFTINPAVAPTITLSSSTIQTCLDSYNYQHYVALPYTATTGSPTTFSIVWDSSLPNTFLPVTDAVLNSNRIDVPVPHTEPAGTYQATLTVKSANGLVSNPIVFNVNLEKSPTIYANSVVNPVSASTSSQTTTLDYTGISDQPLSYVIDWDADANAASLADQPSTPFTFSSSGGTITGIIIPANVPAGTYKGVIFAKGLFCEGGGPRITLVINSSGARGTIDSGSEIVETTKSAKNQILITAENKVINVETKEHKIDKVYVFDVSGNLIYKKEGVRDPKLIINDVRSSNQILIIRAVLDNGQTETTKIIY